MTGKIRIIALGGTIAMRLSEGGLEPALSGAGLLSFLEEENLDDDVDWDDFSNIASPNITFGALVRLAAVVDKLDVQGYKGVVISQGTDTLEETAFALELLLQSSINVAFTGAMRSASHISPDGPANIIGALRFLSETEERNEVVVVLNDEVHAARHVRKAHSTSVGAFSSGEFGLRGRIEEGRFRRYNPAVRALPKISIQDRRPTPKVLLAAIGLDEHPSLFEYGQALGLDGWVIDALGAGHVPERLASHLDALAKHAPVVLCSRTGSGGICEATYGYPGGEIDLLARGLLSGKTLSGQKARVLLTLLLMEQTDRIGERFNHIAGRC